MLHAVEPNWPTTPYPVHGIGWLLPWRVGYKSQTSAQLSLERQRSDPYAFRAQYQIIVAEDDVSFTLEITDAGRVALTFGLGFQPYFPRRADTKLSISGTSITTFNAEDLPDHTGDISANDDVRTLTPLAVRGFNHQLNGAYGTHIDQPDDAASLRVELSDDLGHAHLWVPTGRPFFVSSR